ncbi:hypothetical protein SESBI_47177 [Sesbania bispinosa]|nr:hypothetical protein SESBI_47177 [Sesbania bispinosa]
MKHDDKEHIGSRKKACSNEVDMSWGYSTELMLSDDPWKIKKILKESDLGNLSTFLLGRDLAQELVLPVLGVDVDLDNGTQVMIWVWTPTPCTLCFSRDGFLQEAMFSLAARAKICCQESLKERR